MAGMLELTDEEVSQLFVYAAQGVEAARRQAAALERIADHMERPSLKNLGVPEFGDGPWKAAPEPEPEPEAPADFMSFWEAAHAHKPLSGGPGVVLKTESPPCQDDIAKPDERPTMLIREVAELMDRSKHLVRDMAIHRRYGFPTFAFQGRGTRESTFYRDEIEAWWPNFKVECAAGRLMMPRKQKRGPRPPKVAPADRTAL